MPRSSPGEIPNVAPAPDRDVSIRIVDHAPAAALNGDATMLRQVLNSLMFSYRLEVVRSETTALRSTARRASTLQR